MAPGSARCIADPGAQRLQRAAESYCVQPPCAARIAVTLSARLVLDAVPEKRRRRDGAGRTFRSEHPGPDPPDGPLLRVAPGVDPDDAAAGLEAAFLASGTGGRVDPAGRRRRACGQRHLQPPDPGVHGTGVAGRGGGARRHQRASRRRRRQQIGVLRAIGFRTRMVQAAFLLESSFIALTSIVVGTVLDLLFSWNIIRDTRLAPSSENLRTRRAPGFSRGHLPRRLRRRASRGAFARSETVADPAGQAPGISNRRCRDRKACRSTI